MTPTGTHEYIKGKVYSGKFYDSDYYYFNDEQNKDFSHGAPMDFIEEYFMPINYFRYGK
jgi:hypothetical protein